LWAYLGVFAALVAAGLGFPIPEELPVVTGGALAGQVDEPLPRPEDVAGLLALSPVGGLPDGLFCEAAYRCAYPEHDPNAFVVRWWIMLPVCIVGVVFADGLLYGVGRLFGRRLLEHRWLARMLPPDKLERIEGNFHHYGITILLFARFTPGIRAPIFMSAGMMRLPLKRFLLADALYAILGVTALFTLAFWFTNSFKKLVVEAEEEIAHYKWIIILVVAMCVLIYMFIRFWRKPVPVGDPEELPIIGKQVAAHIHPEEDHCPDAPSISEVVSADQPADREARREVKDAEPRS
jgi:membrane protein DedA with SNARE-associated domain